MPKLTLCLLSFVFVLAQGAANLDAATKKKISHKRSEFTAAQREKLMEAARKICKKRHGAMATVYRLDYYKWTVWCREN